MLHRSQLLSACFLLSDLMVTAFGEKGRHARSTIGVAVLPMDAAVEVEGLFEVS